MSLTAAERFALAVTAATALPLLAAVALGTPLLGLLPGALVAVGAVALVDPADRVRLAVGSLTTAVVAGAAVPALALDSDLALGLDGTGRLWVAAGGALLALWAGLAALDRTAG